MSSIPDIDEQIASLNRQRDRLALPGLKQAETVLSSAAVTKLAEDLTIAFGNVSSNTMAGKQIENIIVVLTGARSYIAGEVARIEALPED